MKDLFLCHTGADKDWVRMLGARLEQLRISNRSIEVFFDEWDIDYGENIISKIDAGLKASRYFGLVLTPEMLRADWPTAEWQSQVMNDPAGKRGKILPLLRHKFDPKTGEPIDMPFVLAPLKRFDFTREQDFDRELDRLVRKLADLPPARGPRRSTLGSSIVAAPTGQEAADNVEEALPSNLFLVAEVPTVLYSDHTTARKKRDVWNAMKGKSVPPFVLFENRLVSFVSPDVVDNPFRAFLLGTDPKEERVTIWMSDLDKRRQLVGMLNGALREHCYHSGIFTPKKDRTLFYCPIFKDGKPREFRWGGASGATGRSRTLSSIKTRQDKTQFGAHMAAYMRFLAVGDRLFLLVEPAWFFTEDGITPLEGSEVSRFSTMWGGRERNAALLRNVLMWGLLIANGRHQIMVNVATADSPLNVVVEAVPVHAKIKAGIAGDAIRLDRILGGEGAGEVKDTEVQGGDDPELDEVTDLALIGALMSDDVTIEQALAHNEQRVEARSETGDESGEETEPELPF